MAVMLLCNHKKAVSNAFHGSAIGMKTAVKYDHDILLEMHHQQLHSVIQSIHLVGSELPVSFTPDLYTQRAKVNQLGRPNR